MPPSSAFWRQALARRSSSLDNTPAFNGLIQHSFALRIPPSLCPQYTREDIPDTEALLKALFETPAETDGCSKFCLMSAKDMADKYEADATGKRTAVGDYSILASEEQTTIKPVRLPFSEQKETAGKFDYKRELPSPFDWAKSCPSPDLDDPVRAWDGFIFAEEEPFSKRLQCNDFLIAEREEEPDMSDARAVSWLLCQLLAHRRSRLFGPSLARGIFNVLLPHAILQARSSDRPATETSRGDPRQSEGWIVQPALSLFQVRGHHGFRPIFSMTLFMVPVNIDRNPHEGANESADADCKRPEPQLKSRCMGQDEICRTIQAGWALARSQPFRIRRKFDVSGPLGGYLSALKPSVLKPLGVTASCSGWAYEAKEGAKQDAKREALTLRDITEATLFAISLRMMQGPSGRADLQTRKEIGDRVLTALSASRVSSVIVVDEKSKEPMDSEKDAERPASETVSSTAAESHSGSLWSLMGAIAKPVRVVPAQKYRLDRDFFDNDSYAIGVLPATRCVVVTADRCSQRGYQESGLLEAGWIAYMVIGAATATGMIRSIYYDIEQVNRSKPGEIAEIEREGVVDLHEIFDLDITWETYRHRYRLLRNRLCITREYEALNDKLQALYRETSTRFEDDTQVRLVWLTAAIVILSALILIGTVVTVVK